MPDLLAKTNHLGSQPPFPAMVQAAPVAMLMLNDQGRIGLANAAAERMFDYPAGTLAGMPIERLIPAAAGMAQDCLRAAAEPPPGAGDVRGLRADGREVPVQLGLTRLDTPDGPGVLAVVTDVTERQRAEQASAYLAAIVEGAEDAIIGKTLEGVVTTWNRAAEQILGWPAREIVGKRVTLIIPSDRREEEARILERVRAGQSVSELATARLHRDGAVIPVSLTVSPIRDRGGRVVGASTILRDASERRRGEREMLSAKTALEAAVAERSRELAEQLEARRRAEAALAQSQKLEAVGQLTGGVAHDFNNLLTVIEGNLHLIHHQIGSNDALGRAVSGIERAVERGSRLTGHLLAFARRQALLPQVVKLDEVVREFSLLVVRAVGDAVRLSIDTEPNLWPCLIDRAQFESAVLNMSINARDAMPDGGTLILTLRNADSDGEADLKPGRYVSVEVADSGIGMPPGVAARAVEPFFTTKEVGKGSGLGLSQVFGFVQQSGGALRIVSRPGKGTRITMLFPATEAPASAAPAPAQVMAMPAATVHASVMVVEDDPELLELFMDALRGAGHRVTAARDGPEALSLLADGKVADVLVCDVVMPGQVSGVELGHQARKLRPDTQVLLISGYTRDELERMGGVGTFSFLAKPFRPGELVSRVRALIVPP